MVKIIKLHLKKIRQIAFPRVLVLCEIWTALSRIWTLFAISISYDNNYYTEHLLQENLLKKKKKKKKKKLSI